jgi:hypothetical protein
MKQFLLLVSILYLYKKNVQIPKGLLLHNEMSNEQYVSYIHDENKLSSPYIRTGYANRTMTFYCKGVIRIRNSMKDRQHNDQKIKDKEDKQQSTKHTHKTKDRVTRTPPKYCCEFIIIYDALISVDFVDII